MSYKLSKILKAIDDINKIDQETLLVSVNSELKELINILNEFNLVNNGKAKRDYNLVIEKINQANSTIKEILELSNEFYKKISAEKNIAHQTLLKEINNKSYVFEWPNDNDYLQHRRNWKVSGAVIEQVTGLIGKYIDWRFPIVYMEPHTAELTRYLISGDPFYFVDERSLPYEVMLKSMPVESINRIYHYKKSSADVLEPNSAGMCVSWQNIPFKKIGEIRKDIELMAKIAAPGGYVVFDYIDANNAESADAIEQGLFSFQWRERILQFLNENNLEILHEIKFLDYHPVLLFCKKSGELPELNLNNKLGLVLPDHDVLKQKRKEETELRKFYKNITSSLQKDIDAIEQKDRLLNELDQQRQVDLTKITESKLKSAVNHLEIVLSQYSSEHPAVIEALLRLSKLTYSIGRIKDSFNLIKRASNDIKKIDADNKLYKDYHEWTNFLNNIDT